MSNFRLPRGPLKNRGMKTLTALFSLVALLGGCSLPKQVDVTPSFTLDKSHTQGTRLHQAIAPLARQHPDLSGIYPLADAFEAFAVRMHLTAQAQKTLDVQYYIWRADATGLMLLEALYEAAERGVRVRLLLDDNGTRRLDDILLALHEHPNIEVRLFNPFVIRNPKGIGFFFDFERLNHRMHNKSFTVDNSVTIVGGRNVGDGYFGADGSLLFADLDVLAVGQVVPEVSADFDRYWNNDYAFPIDLIATESHANKSEPTGAQNFYPLNFSALLAPFAARQTRFLQAAQQVNTVRDLLSGSLDLEWVKTEMVSDDPAKAQGKATPESMLSFQLHHAIGNPRERVDLISPYFVPTATGVLGFAALINENNVQVRVLTNSYEATDVAIVHAGYMKHRKKLLRAGVKLYELKKISNGSLSPLRRNPLGISGSSLHAKTFAVDGKRLFVGSFNFDPRSALLNTELGFVIHSERLAQQVSDLFEEEIPQNSYEVILTRQRQLRWLEPQDNPQESPIIHEVEPGTTLVERLWLGFISRLPIEWLL